MDTELKNQRLLHHLTQAQVAAAIGVDTKTYRRYEHGLQLPPLDTALRLARYYFLCMEKLFPPESVLPELKKGDPS